MFCEKCGTQITEEAKFCPNCGAPLKKEVPVQDGPIAAEAETTENVPTAETEAEAHETRATEDNSGTAEAVVSPVEGSFETVEGGEISNTEISNTEVSNAETSIKETAVEKSGIEDTLAQAADEVASEADAGGISNAEVPAVTEVSDSSVTDPADVNVSNEETAPKENLTEQYARRIAEQKAATGGGAFAGAMASGEQNGQYNGQPGQYNGQTGQYNGQAGQYNGQPGQYNGQTGQYNGQTGQYNGQAGQYNGQTGQYNGQAGQYNGQTGQYNGQTGQFSGRQGAQGQFGQGQPGYGNNGGPQYNAPKPKNSLATAGNVLAIVALVLAFFQVFHVLGSFFGIVGSFADEGVLGFIYGVGNFVIQLIKMCGLLGSALVMFLIWKKWDDNKAEPLMVGTLAGGIVIVLSVIVRAVFVAIFNAAFGYDYASMFSGAFLSVIFAIVMMALTYVFMGERHINPLAGLQGGNAGDTIKKDIEVLSDMAVEAKNEYQSGKNNPSGNANYNYNGVNQNYNQYQQQGQSAPYGGVNGAGQPNVFASAPLATDRSLVTYILLGFVTCGIYSLYMLHCIIKDVNITCAGDGKTTSSIWAYIGFGILTCGIYDMIWLYNLGNRLQYNAPRYGMNFQENGTTVLLWELFGAVLCGVGPFIAAHIIIKNSNALNAAYNNMMFQQNR
ncbi:DUF4234 domain-containing protein [Oribacterium sp. WCC10]|uniref:DUF4234 domain-containing protein n=1 Tax=Oribacterium sp. WCC10 TaxID=1855343 RepID=UPI0008E910CB|nr:DUF4234 domain-containing protein [Oribacterium sp. WCC10]SFG15115.1 protein of unknown function [Oribacterium sp. WCC10]